MYNLFRCIVIEQAKAGVRPILGRQRGVQDHIVKHEVVYGLILPLLMQLYVRIQF